MVALILGTGFEPLEAVAPCDILRRGGIEVCCASVGERLVEAGHGIRIEADCTVAELDAEKLDMIVLPGGLGGVQSILGSEETLELIRRVYDEGKFVAAICAAPSILAKLDGHVRLIVGDHPHPGARDLHAHTLQRLRGILLRSRVPCGGPEPAKLTQAASQLRKERERPSPARQLEQRPFQQRLFLLQAHEAAEAVRHIVSAAQ